jgi:hypothetical protein
MRLDRIIRTHLTNQRGIGLVGTCLLLTAFLALTAVGLDVGRLAFTASEVQSAADIAATAGATAVIKGRDAQTDANTVLGSDALGSPLNMIDGQAAYPGATTTVEVGTIDPATGSFNPGGGAAANAARATSVATVQNLFAGVFGADNASTTVTKTAIAALTSTGSGAPQLPLALADGCFQDSDCSEGEGHCPNALCTQSNGCPTGVGNTAAWTGFNSANCTDNGDGTINNFVPTASCAWPQSGGDQPPPLLNTPTCITLNNGTLTNVYKAALCYWCTHKTKTFLVPVFQHACDGTPIPNTGTAIGFATIMITDFVNLDGSLVSCTEVNPNPRGIIIKSVRSTNNPGTVGGCPHCGTGFVRLAG